jgi:hypothetical protein
MSEEPKIKAKWMHNQRVSHDNLREGLEALKIGVEEAIKETEGQLKKYQETLVNLTGSRKVRK